MLNSRGYQTINIYIYILRPMCRSCYKAIMVIAMRAHCNPLDTFTFIYIYCILIPAHFIASAPFELLMLQYAQPPCFISECDACNTTSI